MLSAALSFSRARWGGCPLGRLAICTLDECLAQLQRIVLKFPGCVHNWAGWRFVRWMGVGCGGPCVVPLLSLSLALAGAVASAGRLGGVRWMVKGFGCNGPWVEVSGAKVTMMMSQAPNFT